MKQCTIWYRAAAGTGVLLGLGGMLLYVGNGGPWADEQLHVKQILHFFDGHFRVDPNLAMIPGYHLAMAGLARLLDDSSLPALRACNAVFGLLSIAVFALILKRIHHRISPQRVVAYAFFPILTPFFFLVYTETLSLLLVLVGLHLGLTRRYVVAGLICLLSMLIRQSNIVWLVMVPIVAHAEQGAFRLPRTALIGVLRSSWTFLLGVLAFVTFAVVNAGIALGGREAHPSASLHTGNLFFMMFLYGLLFLPQVLHRSRQTLRLVGGNPSALLAGAAVLLLYLLTFENTHPFNTNWGDYYLRNQLLIHFTSTTPLKLLFFVPILLALFDIMAHPLERESFASVYVFIAIALLPLWLIEQRYYIIPFTLLLLFRREESPSVETITSVAYVLLSAVFVWGIRNDHFFL